MEFKFIKHTDISTETLFEIVSIKSKQWNYTNEQHLKWIIDNIQPNDIHVLMSIENKNLAYMNLVQIEVVINNIKLPFLGIGNVCAIEKGKGYGRNLMNGVNEFLEINNFNAILLCKDELVNFYTNFNWKLVKRETIINSNYLETNLMTFNLNQKIESLRYVGRNF